MTEPTSPIQIADYRRFLLARFPAVISSTGISVVLGWQVYDVARSAYGMSREQAAFQLGVIGLSQFLPLFVLAPFAGLVADRFDRRKISACALGLNLLMATGMALLTLFGRLTLPELFGLASLNGVARAFAQPAMSAIAPNVVPARLIPRAIGINSIAFTTGQVLGPALGGLFYAVMPALPYFVSMAVLSIAIGSVLSIKPFPMPQYDHDKHPLRQIAEGFTFMWRTRLLLGCMTLDLFAVLLGGATALLPVYARDILHVGASGLGVMRAAPAIGSGLFALLLSWRPIEKNVGVKMLWAVAGFGAATALFGVSHSFWLSLALLAALGSCDMISVFIRGTLEQLSIPNEMRGRVSSISTLAISASNELGEMQSGVAAALLGPIGAVVFGGVGAIVVTGLWAWIFPELRRAKSFATQYRQ